MNQTLADLYTAWGFLVPSLAILVSVPVAVMMIRQGGAYSMSGKITVAALFLVAAVSVVGLAFTAKTWADFKSLSPSTSASSLSYLQTSNGGKLGCCTGNCGLAGPMNPTNTFQNGCDIGSTAGCPLVQYQGKPLQTTLTDNVTWTPEKC